MARIPAEEVERIKREVSLQRLIEARGIKLNRHGADLIGLCPFHADREPSLVVTPAKNLWHCLGACGTGGSAIDWVMKAEGVSFRHAVELLRRGYPEKAAAKGKNLETKDGEVAAPPPRRSTVPKLSAPVAPDADDRAVLREVVEYYHQTLKESPEALRYLESRGLASGELIERFRLGYANRTLGYRIPQKNRQAGAQLRGRLERLGILRESGHEHFNGAVVIPIFGEDGSVAGMYGRRISARVAPDAPVHLYLPGPHRGVWNAGALVGAEEVILCEALLDALSFWAAGFRNVTASYGVNGLTEEHLKAFERWGTKRMLIAYDRDGAGDEGAVRAAARLIAAGIECRRVLFPKGMDANEYAVKVRPAEKSLGLALDQAVPMNEAGIGDPGPGAADEEKAAAKGKAPESQPEPGHQQEASAEPPTPLPLAASEESPATPPEPPSSLPLAASETTEAEPAPRPVLQAEVKGDEVVVVTGGRRYRIRGQEKSTGFEALRVNVLVTRAASGRGPAGTHVDTLDLYAARHRATFVREAAAELGVEEEVIKRDLGGILLLLEDLRERRLQEEAAPKEKPAELTAEERAEALALLQDPHLLDRILKDFEACGVVGEETNKLVGYLAAVSRKLSEPLAVIIQSGTAAGKSSLMEAVLSFVPSEERVKYSAMTGQSLFYMSGTDLRHKVLALVEEEGARQAGYALKLLQSEGELTIASTGKDPATGKLITHEYRVEGPVMIMMTTTAVELDEELLNRCLVLAVDEEREQTRAIHRRQREGQTLEGLLGRRARERILAVHRNAQRLLEPVLVANPYARELTFLDDRTRTRRDHMKYLTLIRAIALLHQHQRPRKTVVHEGQPVHYLEATLSDLEVANRLAHEVLGRSLDELPPQSRRLLVLLQGMVAEGCAKENVAREDYRFTRRQVREHVGWTDFQVKAHMHRLEELEYVVAHRGGRGQGFIYELLYGGEGQDGKPFLMGLIDVERLRCKYGAKKEHPKVDLEHLKTGKEGCGSPQVAPVEGGCSVARSALGASAGAGPRLLMPKTPENALRAPAESASYVAVGRTHTAEEKAAAKGKAPEGTRQTGLESGALQETPTSLPLAASLAAKEAR